MRRHRTAGAPAGPSELASGVVLYEGANFAGNSALVTSDIPNLGDFDGPCEHTGDSKRGTFYDWNDCASSIRVAPGWRATVYEQGDYKGESYMTTGTR
jgi:Peptidase inhibitor family I36